MRTKETTVYTFDELSDSAKERARDWYRQGMDNDNSFSEFVVSDAAEIARMLGIDISTRTVRLMGGGTCQEPVIWWDLGNRQGACFSGRWAYAKGSMKAIRSHAPQDTELHRIARELQQGAQRTGYTAELTINACERSMTVYCEWDTDMSKATYERLDEAIRDFAHWIYKRLRDEYEYQNSDEAVDELIKANEYEFTEEGKRA